MNRAGYAFALAWAALVTWRLAALWDEVFHRLPLEQNADEPNEPDGAP